MEHKVNFLA